MSFAEAGSTIFEDGDSADDLVVVMEGTVDVLKDGRILGTFGPGSLLGEVSAFVPSSSRTATIRANSAVRMIRWRTDHIRSRLARHERLATAIVADMAFVLSERLDRRTEDVVFLLKAAGTRLPVRSSSGFAAARCSGPRPPDRMLTLLMTPFEIVVGQPSTRLGRFGSTRTTGFARPRACSGTIGGVLQVCGGSRENWYGHA